MAYFEKLETIGLQTHKGEFDCTTHLCRPLGSARFRNFAVYVWPTYNCQIFCIAYFASLFTGGINYEKAMDFIREIKTLCNVTKNLCMVDIHKGLFTKIEPYIKVHSSMEYLNLTGTTMVQALIDMRQTK